MLPPLRCQRSGSEAAQRSALLSAQVQGELGRVSLSSHCHIMALLWALAAVMTVDSAARASAASASSPSGSGSTCPGAPASSSPSKPQNKNRSGCDSSQMSTDNYTACEAACCADTLCLAWNWDSNLTTNRAPACPTPGTGCCWLKTCTTGYVGPGSAWCGGAPGVNPGHCVSWSGTSGRTIPLPPPPKSSACSVDEDCSLLGVCGSTTPGVCDCDPGWTGPDCGQLKLQPVTMGTGYNLTAEGVSSWGANIFPAAGDHAGKDWHMSLLRGMYMSHASFNSPLFWGPLLTDSSPGVGTSRSSKTTAISVTGLRTARSCTQLLRPARPA